MKRHIGLLLLLASAYTAVLTADYNETAPTIEIQTTGVMETLVKASKKIDQADIKMDYVANAKNWIEQNKQAMIDWGWRIPAGFLVFGFVCCVIGMRAQGRSLALFCNWMCGQWIFILSVVSIVGFAVNQINLWTTLPKHMWGYPLGFILINNLLLRFIDMNYPVWNSTLKAFLYPAASGFVIAALGKFLHAA